jgi:hypothetical protein
MDRIEALAARADSCLCRRRDDRLVAKPTPANLSSQPLRQPHWPSCGMLACRSRTPDALRASRVCCTAALVKDAPGGYLYFSFLVARVAGALLVQACGSKARAAALVNDWVNENVKIRVRKSA